MKKSACVLALLLLFSTSSIADEYVVITSKNTPEMTLAQLKAIYLKKITFIDNVKMVPLNLGTRDKLRLKFEKQVLNMNFARLKNYWTKQHYLGKRPPLSVKSQDSVKSFIKKVDGSIGYVNASNRDENMKVLYRWSD